MLIYCFIYAIAIANYFLSVLSRNPMFGYFGYLCMIISVGYIVGKYFLPVIFRHAVITGCIGYSLAIIVNVYCHIRYGALSLDYITIILESAICILILLVSILQKQKAPQDAVPSL